MRKKAVLSINVWLVQMLQIGFIYLNNPMLELWNVNNFLPGMNPIGWNVNIMIPCWKLSVTDNMQHDVLKYSNNEVQVKYSVHINSNTQKYFHPDNYLN